jgi:hypothetical protein
MVFSLPYPKLQACLTAARQALNVYGWLLAWERFSGADER